MWSPLLAALQGLEALWRAQAAPIAEHLAAGATAEHFAHIEERLGGPLPPELRTWWAWHDGVQRLQPGLRFGKESIIGPGHWEFLSSTEALAERDERVAWMPTPAKDGPDWDGGWRPEWIPFLTMGGNILFVDYRQVTPHGTAPVRCHAHTPDDVFTPDAGSLEQAVRTWTYLLAEEYYRWDPGTQSWFDRHTDIPMPLRVIL